MKLKKLDINKEKKLIIGLVCLFLVGITLIFRATMAKYKLTESIPLARGTINYTSYDFKMIAMYQSEDGENYTEITTMPTSGYVVNEDKSYCTTDNKTQVKGKIKTLNGNTIIANIQKNDKCYIWFDKEKPPITIDDIIATSNAKDTTPDFSKTATTNEGVYKTEDGMYGGYTYYWRGAVEDNHVIFGGFCWRIIRINGDKTMRLIYNGTPSRTTCPGNGDNAASVALTNQAYNTNYNRSEYVGWTYIEGVQRTTSGTASNAKTQTDTWYNDNLANYSSKVAYGKFCNDRNVASGYTWNSRPSSTIYYAAYGRLQNEKTPSFSCTNSGDTYALKVGAITADEVAFAGGVYGTANSRYYLYNGAYYWTMTPLKGATTSGLYSMVFIMDKDAFLGSTNVNVTNPGIRPVINLSTDVTFEPNGEGTSSNPYIVQ